MALAGRSSRSGNGRRWLVVGLVVTILVLLVDASVKSAGSGPSRKLSAEVWVTRADGIITRSNVMGRSLTGLRTSTTANAAGVTAALGSLEQGTRVGYEALRKLRPPTALAGTQALLEVCLRDRNRATALAVGAIRAELAAPPSAGATQAATAAVNRAVTQLETADSIYGDLAQTVPAALGWRPPASKWITQPALYGTPVLTAFLAGLRNRVDLQPVHQVGIVAVTTSPGSIRQTGAGNQVQVLSPERDLVVTVVVGDEGNQTESGIEVSAGIAPAAAGTSSVHETIAALAPGTSHAIRFDPLNPPIGPVMTLTVTVTPSSAGTKAVTRKILLQMPSASSATTTTTTIPASSTTTVAGGATSTTVPPTGTTTATTAAT